MHCPNRPFVNISEVLAAMDIGNAKVNALPNLNGQGNRVEIYYAVSYEPEFEGFTLPGTDVIEMNGEVYLLVDFFDEEWDELKSPFGFPEQARMDDLPGFAMTGVNYARVYRDSIHHVRLNRGPVELVDSDDIFVPEYPRDEDELRKLDGIEPLNVDRKRR